jgi:putative CocE/NonD family hydrolase
MIRRLLAVLLLSCAVYAQTSPTMVSEVRGQDALGTAGWTPALQQADRYEVIVQKSVMVTMRDGVKLATDIYFPARNGKAVEGKFPVIMERTPYGKATARGWANYFVARGYIGVAQDTRGRFESEGIWRFLTDDPNDGYDTAQWLGTQPWFAGAIGTVGTSYPGGTQHALALANAPYLKAMVPSCAVSNPGEFGMRHQGAFEMRFFNWIFNIGGPNGSVESKDPKTKQAIAEAGEHVREYAVNLPLRKGTTPLKLMPEYEDWLVQALSHGGNDAFWRNSGTDIVDHIAQYKDIPVLHITGWYDSWPHSVADMTYPALAKAKKSPQRLLVGPWTHGALSRSFAGEADFGAESTINFLELQERWFEHWLKGVDNGVEKEAPVRIFVMGGGDAHKTPEGRIFVGGHWREEREWPLKRAVATPYYLRADGVLSTKKPALEKPTRYQFDPRHPVPTIGGNISSENAPPSKKVVPARPNDTANLMERGAWDQRCRVQFWTCDDERPLSARNDVLVFQTAPLEQDMEVTGPLVVKLWASSDAPDTDFTAKLVDVYPPNADYSGGVELNIGDSIVRARFREGVDSPEKLMTPGTVYPFTIALYPTSLVFKKGHRIRVDISSSNFPRFDVNPNTGEPLNDNRRERVATNTVYHDAQHPSQILLPVVPE